MNNIPKPTARRIAAMRNELLGSGKPTLKRRLPEGYDDMAHAELIAKIEADIGFVNKTFYKPNTGLLEIRDRVIKHLYTNLAVAQLHNPDAHCLDDDYCTRLVCSNCYEHDGFLSAYPCPTISKLEAGLS